MAKGIEIEIEIPSGGGTPGAVTATQLGFSQYSLTTTDGANHNLAVIPIANNSAGHFKMCGTAFRTNGVDAAGFEVHCAVYRQGGGGATLVDGIATVFGDSSDLNWGFAWVVSGNNLIFQINGTAAKNVDWVGNVYSETAT